MEIRTELTKNPKQKPDYSKLGFGKYFTDHMFIMDYKTGKGWYNQRIVPYAPIELDPAAMVFHYGQSVFEGLKCYKTEDNRFLLFRANKNFERMNTSDDRICIPAIDVDRAVDAVIKLVNIDKDWIPAEKGTSLYIRPFVIATEPALGVRPSDEYKFMIILNPVGSYYEGGIAPVSIYVEDDYVRSVKGSIGFTKASANYAISLKGQEKAQKLGYSQVLWLDGVEKKYVEEIGTSNAFFKIAGKLITPSLEGSILAGITRDSIITLAKSFGVEVEERKISIEEVFEAHKNGTLEEAFASGTAAVVSPMGKLNWKGSVITINDEKIGNLTQRFYDELTGIQSGRIEDKFGWVREVK